jgi:hypothetical protein
LATTVVRVAVGDAVAVSFGVGLLVGVALGDGGDVGISVALTVAVLVLAGMVTVAVATDGGVVGADVAVGAGFGESSQPQPAITADRTTHTAIRMVVSIRPSIENPRRKAPPVRTAATVVA